jgi:hypothetical protein
MLPLLALLPEPEPEPSLELDLELELELQDGVLVEQVSPPALQPVGGAWHLLVVVSQYQPP